MSRPHLPPGSGDLEVADGLGLRFGLVAASAAEESAQDREKIAASSRIYADSRKRTSLAKEQIMRSERQNGQKKNTAVLEGAECPPQGEILLAKMDLPGSAARGTSLVLWAPLPGEIPSEAAKASDGVPLGFLPNDRFLPFVILVLLWVSVILALTTFFVRVNEESSRGDALALLVDRTTEAQTSDAFLEVWDEWGEERIRDGAGNTMSLLRVRVKNEMSAALLAFFQARTTLLKGRISLYDGLLADADLSIAEFHVSLASFESMVRDLAIFADKGGVPEAEQQALQEAAESIKRVVGVSSPGSQ